MFVRSKPVKFGDHLQIFNLLVVFKQVKDRGDGQERQGEKYYF